MVFSAFWGNHTTSLRVSMIRPTLVLRPEKIMDIIIIRGKIRGGEVYYRMKYYKVESPYSGNSEFIKYVLNTENLLKKALRKAKNGTKEFVAISIYLDNFNKDNRFKGQ